MSARPQPLIHFVIVAAGDARNDLLDVLGSLDSVVASDPRLAVTVVEHGCTPASIDVVEMYPWASLISQSTEIGYGPGINLAVLDMADEIPWIVACNADLVFPPSSIQTMIELAEAADENVAIIAPRLFDPAQRGGAVQPSVGRFPHLASLVSGRLRTRTMRKYTGQPDEMCDIDWATAACLLIRTCAFHIIGGFDDAIFLDYEETDLCRRLANTGWRRRFEPSWNVIHKSPNASRPPDPRRQIHTRASLMRYLARHRPAWEFHAMGAMLRATTIVRSRNHPFAESWQAGLETYRELSGKDGR